MIKTENGKIELKGTHEELQNDLELVVTTYRNYLKNYIPCPLNMANASVRMDVDWMLKDDEEQKAEIERIWAEEAKYAMEDEMKEFLIRLGSMFLTWLEEECEEEEQ